MHTCLSFFLDGGIRNKVGRCSYYETFKKEWSSYFLVWAATTAKCVSNSISVLLHISIKNTKDGAYHVDINMNFQLVKAKISVFIGGGIRTKVGTCCYYETIAYEWSSYFLIEAASLKRLD
jgi:hypothetical protein